MMTRRLWILAAFAAGVVCFWFALRSTGAGHGSYWAVIAFYPCQFLVWAIVLTDVGKDWSSTLQLVTLAAACLPWFPLIVALISAERSGVRKLGGFLLLVHGLGAAGLLILG